MVRTASLLVFLAAFSPEMVAVNQMMAAPPRPGDCKLELVQADMMELSPIGAKWDFLGTVTLAKANTNGLDPSSEAVRSIIRPKACQMGGTSVALMSSTSSSASMGSSGAGITFAVLRPKTAPSAPSQF